ncbi:hypothetical protein CAPTEDRAFT_157156 [Capitella teleta]|uniref:Major facilitator superfamily (MFS) profile domain-containing protein n=1 Tax=Capitella teleta TaxID=283909 RepID=R7TC96_CAPTE|nr:hypothetical protein CAPTEDRAFT_157156 [Capitella teleta]|eukprot:ELT88716.1 hypothetical protein CAPTEDRAFT_157156 [Capitella teleta]
MLQIISGGILLGVGVFIVEFIATFDAEPGAVAWIGSINAGFTFLVAPFGSILVNRYSYRVAIFIGAIVASIGLVASAFGDSIFYLCITYGVITGFGICLVYNLSMIVVGFYFDKRRSLAIGLTVSGTGVGSLIFPPLYRLLIEYYAWRGALIITGGICLHCCIFASLLKPVHYLQKPFRRKRNFPPEERRSWSKQFTDVSILIESKFCVFFLSNVFWALASSTFYVLLPDFVMEAGLGKMKGAWLVSITGLCSTTGRALTAVFMNTVTSVDILHVYSATAVVAGVAMALFPVEQSFSVYVVLCMIFGAFYGAMVTAMPVLAANLFGLEKLTSAFCFLMIANGIGFLLGSPFAGWLYSLTKNYTIAFIVNGICLACTGLVMYTLHVVMCIDQHSSCCKSANKKEPMTVAVETHVTSENGVSMQTKTTIHYGSEGVSVRQGGV